MALAAELKKDFQQLIKNGALAHGYLFFGIPDIQFVQELANYLENGQWGTAERPLLDSLTIGAGIDDIRAGIHFLWQKPLKSPRKTLIIPAGENLTLSAQNAILKTAEEAPSHALILLLARHSETLLPTLRSRFQKIFINDANIRMGTNDTDVAAKNFLKASSVKRKEIIKELIATEDDKVLADFVARLISELGRDKIKNWKALKELLHRWSLINMYNVNKRLQLEAALLQVKSL